MRIKTGLENLIQSDLTFSPGERLGLLANPASVNSNFRHAADLINERFPGRLTALFSPQHGFHAEEQDNMVESDHFTHPELNIPIFSLYGETRVPTREMMDTIDTLIVDIQDVGTRVYTFIYTMSYCMEAAASSGKKIIILDRPNPVNGTHVEGNLISEGLTSFVGRYPIPMRHGLTIGELATLFNDRFRISCNLEVIPMKGWKREMTFSETGLPWVQPSPNLPSPESALVYPGQVIWEGTNVSEGRGTTQPFEFFGAPWLDRGKVLSRVEPKHLEGTVLRPITFKPTSGKWAENPCNGFQIHVTDINSYKPYIASLSLLKAVAQAHEESFSWKQPPYEYEFEKLPIDLILGDIEIRKEIENSKEGMAKTSKTCLEHAKTFRKTAKNYLLY